MIPMAHMSMDGPIYLSFPDKTSGAIYISEPAFTDSVLNV